MANECIYCDGMVICDDDPHCEEDQTHDDLISDGYKHMGCFCVGVDDGKPVLTACGTGGEELVLSLYRKGNRIKVISVSACP